MRRISTLLATLAVAAALVSSHATDASPARGVPKLSRGAGAKAETDTYVAEIKATGAYRSGAEGIVEVTLSAKGDYHINKQYPYKFKTANPAPDGVSYPKPILVRADGTFEEKSASIKVPFVVSRKGAATVGGTFSLSVCSDANCVMDKVTLELPIDVK